MQAIYDQLSRIEQVSSSADTYRVVPEPPPSQSVGAIEITDNSSDKEES